MNDSFAVRLPWPPTATSANKSSPGNWWEKSGAAASYKKTCAMECLAQKVRKLSLPDGDVSVTVTYHPPSLRRIDWDGLAHRCKQGFDAVADATGIDDGRWWPVLSVKGEKVKGGAVIVSFDLPE